MAIYGIHAYPPSIRRVYPPSTKLWWPNFPGRDCADPHAVEEWFRFFERREPAHPRT